jgi:GcrA cell cycle regulator
MEWSDQLKTELTTLWDADRLSAAEIATEMGNGLTRNAVIGKARRMGLKEKRAKSREGSKHHDIKLPRPLKAKKFREPVPAPMPIEPLNIGYLELETHHCREIVCSGDNGLPVSCGHPTVAGYSYCAWHKSINYHPQRPPREITALQLRARKRYAGTAYAWNDAA